MNQSEIDAYFAARDRQRQKRRVMTMGEYVLWSRCGDAYDSPTNNDCFVGGLTIILDGRPPIFGHHED